MTLTTERPAQILDDLQSRLRERRVIPFVGSGVSRAVCNKEGNPLFPTWRELLTNAINLLPPDHSNSFLVKGFLNRAPCDYLNAAKYAREGLGSRWVDFLRNNLNPDRELVDDTSLALAREVWGLKSRLVITTNYDKVLRWACQNFDNLESWDIEAAAEQSHFLRGDLKHPTVWHLHGKIENCANLILTPDGYQRLYPTEGITEKSYLTALTTLQNTIATYTLLFIGFSMDDDAVRHQLESVSEIFQGCSGPHYILAHKNDIARIKERCPQVETIQFDEYGQPLIDLVHQLGEIAAEGVDKITVTSEPMPSVEHAPKGDDYSPQNRPFTVPFNAKKEHFIGHDGILETVREKLLRGRCASIGQAVSFQGLGGLGKTQLAVEYAHQFNDCYINGVIWINADQDIDAQLTTLADTAKWISPLSEHKDKLAVALQRVRSYSDTLLIFDNVEKHEDIEPYLPLSPASPHILITSRTV